eukprot:NODE_11393_length_307_cov_12.523256_g10480_i0.p2 GENE.NODE_11393_length_307_cov_12.523256_g10480_i0~~NODE_11393_length_307_cov_12.523256_g10480_i0.p2  ORF type:complete len:87 (+),score=24.88 NODE_11393_length_307_cov_12.523256_g10480_i0:29-262(+)
MGAVQRTTLWHLWRGMGKSCVLYSASQRKAVARRYSDDDQRYTMSRCPEDQVALLFLPTEVRSMELWDGESVALSVS